MMARESGMWKEASGGTYADGRLPRGVAGAFVALALALMLVPFVGMVWARTDSTTENRELEELPGFTDDDGSPNVDMLSDLGAYFDDHFAYRNQAVTANARLRAALGASPTDQVVVGTDGWLYYGGTLADFRGQNQLTERSLENIAHNLALAQQFAQSHGAAFAFTLAPNKNTLAPEHMPANCLRYEGESNAARLKPYLQREGVNYVDLFDLLSAQRDAEGQPGYLKLDSHWNNRWALLAANELMRAVGHDALPVNPDAAVWREDFAGDLQSMLYPAAPVLEENAYFCGYNDGEGGTGAFWAYAEGSDVTDSTIRTQATATCAVEGPAEGASAEGAQLEGNAPGDGPAASSAVAAGGQGSLLMFRDSFGNALLPFMAAGFQDAAFSKLVPYNLTQMVQLESTAVVVERAERHLYYLAANPPIMTAPRSELPEGASELEADIEVTTGGSFWVVRGTLADEPEPGIRLYVTAEAPGADPVTFDPFYTSQVDETGAVLDDRGFLLYVPTVVIDLPSATITAYGLQ